MRAKLIAVALLSLLCSSVSNASLECEGPVWGANVWGHNVWGENVWAEAACGAGGGGGGKGISRFGLSPFF